MRSFRVSTKIYEIGDSEISISSNQPIRINQAFNREKKISERFSEGRETFCDLTNKS